MKLLWAKITATSTTVLLFVMLITSHSNSLSLHESHILLTNYTEIPKREWLCLKWQNTVKALWRNRSLTTSQNHQIHQDDIRNCNHSISSNWHKVVGVMLCQVVPWLLLSLLSPHTLTSCQAETQSAWTSHLHPAVLCRAVLPLKTSKQQ